jgi:phenylpropionate dioxygenase-like ring-hydroxylating dioxygenase large terminal subunit
LELLTFNTLGERKAAFSGRYSFWMEGTIRTIMQIRDCSPEKAIALVYENESLTYRELNDRANQLAHYLQTLGVKTEVLVGICVERSLQMIVGILAILKAGGAYVPFDPAYPQERESQPQSHQNIGVEITNLLNSVSPGDAALFALEVEHLIKPTWQFVCHINEVPQPGNFTWLDIVGERAYVIRTASGELFAGKLQDVTQRGSYPQFGLPNYGLEPIDIDILYGFIFIRFSWEGSRLAESWYLPGLLEPYQLENMQPIGGAGRYDINVEVDYKLLWENFLEDYHFPMMHKGLTRRFGVSSDCEGINGMIIPMRDPASPSLTPIERQYYDCAKAIARHSWEHEQQLQDFAAQNHSLPETLCYSAFCSMSAQEEIPMPFSLSVFPEHVQTFSLVPAGPRECRFHVRSYGHTLNPDHTNTKAIEDARRANIQLLVESLHEDIRVNYICQDSVSSRLFEKIGVFSIAEFDVAKFQEAIYTKLPITRRQQKPL